MVQKGWEDVYLSMELHKMDSPVLVRALRKVFFAGAAFGVLHNSAREEMMREVIAVLDLDV